VPILLLCWSIPSSIAAASGRSTPDALGVASGVEERDPGPRDLLGLGMGTLLGWLSGFVTGLRVEW